MNILVHSKTEKEEEKRAESEKGPQRSTA